MNASKAAEGTVSVASKTQTAIQNTARKLTNSATTALGKDITSTESPLFWILITLAVGVFIYCILTIQNNWASRSTPNNVTVTIQDRKAIFDVKFASQYKDKKTLRQAIQEQDETINKLKKEKLKVK